MAARRSPCHAFTILVFCVSLPCALGVEPGDFDGDGRLSLADIQAPFKREVRADALDPFLEYPCMNTETFPSKHLRGMILMEVLRRAVPDSLPYWERMWPDSATTTPLPSDPRVRARVENVTVEGGDTDTAEVVVILETEASIESLILILESDEGILRPPPSGMVARWDDIRWLSGDLIGPQKPGEIKFGTSPAMYLMTNGRNVVAYNLTFGKGLRPLLEPGDYRIPIKVCLPKEAKAGEYELRILPGSEILFEDETIAAPTAGEPGTLKVLNDVTTGGCGESMPPIVFDAEARQVLGRIEYRVVDAMGNPSVPGLPIAEVRPGESFEFQVQMRTEVPLNQIFFWLQWPENDFCCSYNPFLLDDPENPDPENPGKGFQVFRDGVTTCAPRGASGLRVGHVLRGAGFTRDASLSNLTLDYFPVGVWVDLASAELTVPEWAEPGRKIDLTFARYDRSVWPPPFAFPAYIPYDRDWPCRIRSEHWPLEGFWDYHVEYNDTFVRVPDAPPRLDAGDLAVTFSIDTVRGSPGELVTVPVYMEDLGDPPVKIVRLVLEVDQEELEFEGVEIDFVDPKTREVVFTKIVATDSYSVESGFVCRDSDGDGVEDHCKQYLPPSVQVWRGDPPNAIVIEMWVFCCDGEFLIGDGGGELLRLLMRVPSDSVGNRAALIEGAKTTIRRGVMDVEVETSGILSGPWQPCLLYQRAPHVNPGLVLISARMVRGDANVDGVVDIADVVATLLFEFVGGDEPACLDASDADDNGVLEVTDAIASLSYQFLGTGNLPPPFPNCGADLTEDDLVCRKSCQDDN